MAQKITVVLDDDLDGGPASETVLFSLDGVAYEIDLNDGNAAGLRDAMAPYVGAGRRTGGRSASGRHTGARPGPQQPHRRDPRLGPRQRPQGERARPDVPAENRRRLREIPRLSVNSLSWLRTNSGSHSARPWPVQAPIVLGDEFGVEGGADFEHSPDCHGGDVHAVRAELGGRRIGEVAQARLGHPEPGGSHRRLDRRLAAGEQDGPVPGGRAWPAPPPGWPPGPRRRPRAGRARTRRRPTVVGRPSTYSEPL